MRITENRFQIKNENIESYKLIQRGFLGLNNQNIISMNFLVGYFNTIQEAYDCKFYTYFSKINDEVILVIERNLYDEKLEDIRIYWREWWNYQLNVLDITLEKFSNKNVNEILEMDNFYEDENFIPCSKRFDVIFSECGMNFTENQKYFFPEIIDTDETNIFPILDENVFDEIVSKR